LIWCNFLSRSASAWGKCWACKKRIGTRDVLRKLDVNGITQTQRA